MLDFDGFYAATYYTNVSMVSWICQNPPKKLVVDFGGFRICPISTLTDSDGFRTPAFCVWKNWWILVDSGYFLVKIPKGLGFKPAILFWTANRRTSEHAFRFLRVLPEAVSTRHSWLWQTLDDVYTRRCFSESEGTRFGAPGQKALPSVNEFTLLWIFA